MLNKLIQLVDQLGGQVEVRDCGIAEHVLVLVDDAAAEFVVHTRGRAPYPAEVPGLRHLRDDLQAHRSQWQREYQPPPSRNALLVSRYVSESLGRQLTDSGWSWVDSVGNCDLRAPGMRVHIRSPERPPARSAKLPMGPANLRIVRHVLSHSSNRQWSTGDLAANAGTSPVVATQTMRRLEKLGLCQHLARGVWAIAADALLDRFLEDYPGPRGTERYFYGDVDVRSLASWFSHSYGNNIGVSADVGPDLLAPYRVPTSLIVYSKPTVRITADLGLVEVPSMGAANIIQVFPKDTTVFTRASFSRPTPDLGDIQLADPIQMIWDLERLGGEDREHAALEMRRWLNR